MFHVICFNAKWIHYYSEANNFFAPAHFSINNVIFFLGWVYLFPTAKNTTSDSIKPVYSSQLTFIAVGSFGLELLVSSQTKFKTCSQFEMEDFRLSLSWFLESMIMIFACHHEISSCREPLVYQINQFLWQQKTPAMPEDTSACCSHWGQTKQRQNIGLPTLGAKKIFIQQGHDRW